ALMLKYGKLGLIDEMSGTLGQSTPAKAGPGAEAPLARPAAATANATVRAAKVGAGRTAGRDRDEPARRRSEDRRAAQAAMTEGGTGDG
ncbi:MAG TPA: hypothetical protein VEG29_01195, partial [Candidatus Binatia bacterium]|nr:hypothetical protein [Candidatus Binatia bacterium]